MNQTDPIIPERVLRFAAMLLGEGGADVTVRFLPDAEYAVNYKSDDGVKHVVILWNGGDVKEVRLAD